MINLCEEIGCKMILTCFFITHFGNMYSIYKLLDESDMT